MRRLLTGLLGVTLLVSACGDDDDGDRSAVTSIPERSTTTSTTTTAPAVPPPDVIPQDVSLITEEYVEQVLNALYEVSLEAVELARAEGVVDQPSISLIEATSSAEVALQRTNDLIASATSGFEGVQEAPGPMVFEVVDLIDAGRDCVLVEVRTDSSQLLVDPYQPDGLREFVRLYPAAEEQRQSGLNPTAWVVDQFPVTLDGSAPQLECGR